MERRVRDHYKSVYPGAVRTKTLRQEADNDTDIEGTPYWVQVKGRAAFALVSLWKEASKASDGREVHLCIQERGGEPFVLMPLKTFMLREASYVRQLVDDREDDGSEA